MADDNTPKEAQGESRSRAAKSTRTKAQVEFDRYKARLGSQARAVAGGFAQPPAFSIQGAAVGGWPGGGWPGGAPYGPAPGSWGAAAPWPGMYGGGPVPPQLGPDTLTDRLRTTMRLGVDVLNATLVGGLRVMGGLTDVAAWAWSYPPRGGYGGSHGCGCGGGSSCGCHSSCGCDCCTVLSCDPCCSPGVSSCGCGCGC